MAIRVMHGFDHSTVAADYGLTFAGSASISSAQARTGPQSIVMASTGDAILSVGSAFTLGQTFGVAFGYRPSWALNTPGGTPLDGGAYHVVAFAEGSAYHVRVGILADGNVVVTRLSSELGRTASPPAALAQNAWTHWEVKLNCHDSTGAVVVQLNAVEILNLSGVDTRNAGSGTIDTVRFSTQSNFAGGCVDDVIVWDTTGGVVDDFVGDKAVAYVPDDGAGNHQDWTANTGTNPAAVDETGNADGDTTYVGSSTIGNIDTYTHASVPAGSIIAVQSILRARKDDAGSRSIRPVWRYGGSDHAGSTVSINDTYTTFREINYTVDPNASEHGFEVVS